MTEALKPVPKFVGQVPKKPSVSFHINFVLLASADSFKALDKEQNLVKTEGINMEKMLAAGSTTQDVRDALAAGQA